MGWNSNSSVADILRSHQQFLDDLFGSGAYQIRENDTGTTMLITDWVEVSLAYDWRDQWVASMVRPLRVAADLSEEFPSDTLLRFCDVDLGVRRKSQLDAQQITDELNLIRPLVDLFRDEQKSRDASWFARGYCAAYTDWASGNFG